MGGLEPPRISPHAPQTCAYTDSATSTNLFNFQPFSFVMRRSNRLCFCPLVKRLSIFLLGRVPHRLKLLSRLLLLQLNHSVLLRFVGFVLRG